VRFEILGLIVGPLFAFFSLRLLALARRTQADTRAAGSDELDSLMVEPPGPHPFELWLLGWFFTVGGGAVFVVSLYDLIARGK